MENERPKDVIEDIIDLENTTPSADTDPEDTHAVDSDLAVTDPAVHETDTTAPEPQPATSTVYKGAGVRWGLLGGLLLAVLIVVLAAQNTASVEFAFLNFSFTAPLSAIILGTAVIAVVLDELAGWIWGIQKRRRLRNKAELKQLKAEQEPEKKRRFSRS